MSLQIRPATRLDAGLIRRMVLGEGLDPTTLKWENFLIAEQDGEIIGCGQIKRYGGIQELGSLVVKRAYRGRGIASQMIRALERKADPAQPLYLLCQARLGSYYARFGYREITPGDAPRPLRLKWAIPRLLRVKVIAMVRDITWDVSG